MDLMILEVISNLYDFMFLFKINPFCTGGKKHKKEIYYHLA